MPTSPKLEQYLSTLESTLRPLPISDRAEIVTEIKSHVLSAMERDPSTSLESVLAGLGEPQTVANRYLMERGQNLVKPPVSPLVKWIIIGGLGMTAFFFLTAGLMLWKFSPILSVDDTNDRVILLGGLIDIDGKADTVKVGSLRINGGKNRNSATISDQRRLDPNDKRSVTIKIPNAKLEIASSGDSTLSWKCDFDKDSDGPDIQDNPSALVLDFNKAGSAKCSVKIPEKHVVTFSGNNGKVVLTEPKFDVNLTLTNGKVRIEPAPDTAYKYELKSTNGKIGKFVSSDRPDAFHIRISMVNGLISSSDEE